MKDKINVEDLHPTYQAIAEIIGLENTLALGREYEGDSIYFPKFDSHMSSSNKEKDKKIFKEFTGHNYRQLAKKYSLTTIQIRRIINKQKTLFADHTKNIV